MAIHESYPADSTNRFGRAELSEAGTWVAPIGELYDDQTSEEVVEPKNPFFSYVDSYGEKFGTWDYNAHVAWALRVFARTEQQLATAESAEQATAIQAEFKATEANNVGLFNKAADFIVEQKAASNKALLDQMQAALVALETGDKDTYVEIERILHDTNSIDTADIRARIAEDRAVND